MTNSCYPDDITLLLFIYCSFACILFASAGCKYWSNNNGWMISLFYLIFFKNGILFSVPVQFKVFPDFWCVWALTHRPKTLLISLTNWVKVAWIPHPSTSSSIEIRACLWTRGDRVSEGTKAWRKWGRGPKERGRNQSPRCSAPFTFLLLLPPDQLMWWVNLAVCLPACWRTQKYTHLPGEALTPLMDIHPHR